MQSTDASMALGTPGADPMPATCGEWSAATPPTMSADRGADPVSVSEAIATRATFELLDRTQLTVLVHPLFLLLIALATPYFTEFPWIILGTGTVFVVLGVGRVLLARAIKRHYDENPRFWRRCFRLGLYSSAIVWGTFFCITLALHPVESTTWLVLLVTAALGAGLVNSLTADFFLASRYLSFLLGPALAWSILHGYEAYVIAIVVVLYTVYLFQAKEQNRWYMQAVTDNELLKARSRELAEARDAADAANRAKSDFLANMSHDIRTPMNAIIGMTDLVLDSEVTAEQADQLLTVRSSSDSLLCLINEILDFSKIEAGKLEMEHIEFDLADCLRDTVRSLAIKAQEKNVALTYELADGLPTALVGDPGRLRQVLTNLLGNAIKFTERGSVALTVRPKVERETNVVMHFAVADTGIGIPPERVETIFGAFEQADASTTREYGGTGLGLAIASQLVDLMGGKLRVDSTVGEGSTFHFEARFGIPEQPIAKPVTDGAVDLDDARILVLDDDPTRRGLEHFLKSWSVTTTTVNEPEAVMAAIDDAGAGRPYDLVILAYSVPKLEGFDLAAAIRSRTQAAGTRVMMLGSEGQIGDGGRCREAGIAAYLTGHVARAELREAIVQVLRQSDEDALVTRHSLREGQRRLTVLLAEDNRANQKLAISILERRGHSVVVANDGRAAVERAREGGFDIVLMDVQMPEMDGFEATACIRELEATSGGRVPIIAMTAHALKGYREQCLDKGMDGYIAKPVNPDELMEVIAEFGDASAGSSETAASNGRAPEKQPGRAAPTPLAAAGPGGNGGPPATATFDEPAVDASEDPGITDVDPPIDEAEALKRADGDPELLGALADIVLEDTPSMLTAIRAAIDAGDCTAVQESAHALKGCVGNVSANPAWKHAERLEHMGRDQDISEAEPAWAALATEIERLRPYLEALRPS